MNEYRALTRREQLEYIIKFLEEQKRKTEENLESAREEYRLILNRKENKNE